MSQPKEIEHGQRASNQQLGVCEVRKSKIQACRSPDKGREGWVAHVLIKKGRANGVMLNDGKTVRQFDVKCEYGEFAVDIGTGSGVKVKFKVP